MVEHYSEVRTGLSELRNTTDSNSTPHNGAWAILVTLPDIEVDFYLMDFNWVHGRVFQVQETAWKLSYEHQGLFGSLTDVSDICRHAVIPKLVVG